MKPTIGIWGCGVVGGTTAKLFEPECNLLKYDKYKEGNWHTPEELVVKSDFIFVCLPTPMKETGEIDLSFLDITMREIDYFVRHRRHTKPIVIIRSTSVSGSSDYYAEQCTALEVAFVPEFLTENNDWEDTLRATRIVIGTNNPLTFFTIKSLFRIAYKCREIEYIHMSRSEAEMYKYACNYFLAMQVLAANELYFICKKLGINYQKIQEHLYHDKRIGSFTEVPGHDGDFGVGGKCFVKDINALAHLAKKHGYDPKLLQSAIDLNERVRKNKDWLSVPGAVSIVNLKKSECRKGEKSPWFERLC